MRSLTLALIAIFCCVPFLSCTSTLNTQITPEDNELIREVKPTKDAALARALAWQPDAYLTAVSVRSVKENDAEPSRKREMTFEFRSLKRRNSLYAITYFSDDSVEVFEWKVDDTSSRYQPIQDTDWKVDSQMAVQVARTNSEFKLSELSRIANLRLERMRPPGTGPVLWYVALEPVSHNILERFWIDANTGVIIDKE